MTTTIDLQTAPVTRFDVRENEDGDEIRLFHKRVLLFRFGVDDIALEDWEDKLTAFIAEKPRTSLDCENFLSSEEGEFDEDGEEEGGDIIPRKYREKYGAAQNCGDQIALVLTGYVTLPRATKTNIDGGLDRDRLREVATANGIAGLLQKWEDKGLNGGLLRMNVSNVLRGMDRRGERVEIGSEVWEAREVEKKPRTRSKKG